MRPEYVSKTHYEEICYQNIFPTFIMKTFATRIYFKNHYEEICDQHRVRNSNNQGARKGVQNGFKWWISDTFWVPARGGATRASNSTTSGDLNWREWLSHPAVNVLTTSTSSRQRAKLSSSWRRSSEGHIQPSTC